MIERPVERAVNEPLAIIGIGCRFPGKANTPEQFWELLRDGVDAITEMPADRFDLLKLYDPDPSKPGKIYTRFGGFVEGIENFDAQFFGLSPREATRIDPQHRLLLEVAWEAIEDAGQSAERLVGSKTGVFIGISTHDYGDVQTYPVNRNQLDMHSNIGTATSIAANRISYLYDLRGPSIIVDTACSSSLTAVHLACQSMRAGECSMALVGGVQVLLVPELTMGFCKATMLSPDGKCHAFDARANGYVRSEGAGVVVLKFLSDAIADSDPIYAVIKGSAINQDGRTNGITVPRPGAQEAMLRDALANARIAASDVDYIEAHGTGTPVGDPIEADALGAVFSEGRNGHNGQSCAKACAIGSVKTNIGHLEAASGMAGLIKTVLALKHRQIPPTLHFQRPNPAINLDELNLRVVTDLESFPSINGDGKLITAGVNSFGFGGANAHVVLQEAPRRAVSINANVEATLSDAPLDDVPLERAHLLTISARSPEALKAFARSYIDFLSANETSSLADICYTAALRRAHHDYRLGVVANSIEDLIDSLDAFVAGETRANVLSERAFTSANAKLAFVFSGMGPQWWGMGRQLMRDEPLFREMIERCDELLRPHADWSLLEELAKDEADSRVGEADLAQVTNLAIQVALAELWKSWGIVPDAVIGHSAGEMAAAHVAGMHDLPDTVKLAYHRSRLQSRATGQGKMLAVGMSPGEVKELLSTNGNGLAVALATVNSPSSVTLSGDTLALEALMQKLQQRQIFARMLPVVVPYHSSKMDSIQVELLESLATLEARPANIPVVSEVTGTWTQDNVFDAYYWWQNVRLPVLFADGINRLIQDGYTSFLEVSPHPVLAASITECLSASSMKGTVLPSLRRMEDERGIMLRSLAWMYVHGRPINWRGLFPVGGNCVSLPHYPWQRERHWFESQAVGTDGNQPRGSEVGEHPLLGRRVRAANPLWETTLEGDGLGYLDDHKIQGAVVYPGAAYIEMALAAAKTLDPTSVPSVRDVEFHKALFLHNRSQTLLQFALDARGSQFSVYSTTTAQPSAWTLHASGTVSHSASKESARIDLAAIRERIAREVAHVDCYQSFSERGLEYGAAFCGIERLWQGDGEALVALRLDAANVQAEGYQVHPALLDSAFQTLISAASSDDTDHHVLFLPTGIGEVRHYENPGLACWAYARLTRRDEQTVVGDITIFDADGNTYLEVRALRCRLLEEAQTNREETIDDWLYEYRWEPEPLASVGDATMEANMDSQSILKTDLRAELARMQTTANELSAEFGWKSYYEEVEAKLNDAATHYVVAAFRELGWSIKNGERVSAKSLMDTLGILPRFQSLSERMLEILASAGILKTANSFSDEWEVVLLPEAAHPALLTQALLARHPTYEIDVALLDRCGSQMAAVMRGEVDPSEVLFSHDGFELLKGFYRDAPPSKFYNTLVAETVEAVVASNGFSRPLRILEIGAGTGGTTAYILPKLTAKEVEYTFTDVSPLFIAEAKEQFKQYRFVTTRLLNIEADAVSQGFAEHSFDVVIATNVLHGTPHLTAALEHAKRLLAHGGALILLEITRHPHWLDIIFGLTDGWWKFADRALRPSHPLLEERQWKGLFEQTGFADVTTISDSGHTGEAAQAVIVGRRFDDAPAGISSAVMTVDADDDAEADRWLIFADERGVARGLAEELKRRNQSCTLVFTGAVYRHLDAERFEVSLDHAEDSARLFGDLAPQLPRLRGVVHLWSLDMPSAVDVTPATLMTTQARGCESALTLIQTLSKLDSTPAGVWLITANSQPLNADTDEGNDELAILQSPLWGLARVVMKEQPDVRCRMIDLSAHPTNADFDQLARELNGADCDYEEEVALRGGERYVRRLRRIESATREISKDAHAPQADEAWRAEIDTPGAMNTLALRESSRRAPAAGEVEIKIEAASMNFRDVMLAMGMIPGLESEKSFGSQLLGLDAAGVVVAIGEGVGRFSVGDEVIAIVPGAFAAFATTNESLVVHKPPHLSFEQAASIPCAFVTAHYALQHLGRIAAGESVLVHAATGGVGLAAIQIAKHAEAKIYATAGSREKRDYLDTLGVRDAMDSRSLDFADDIMRRTDGKGVDLVLNSLAGEAIAKGISTLSPYGRFLEIGKRDIYENNQLGLLAFRKNLSFFAIDLDRLCVEKPAFVGEMLRAVVSKFEDGTYQPLPQTEFPVSDLENAFRFMAQAKHIGKVALTLADPHLTISANSDAPLLFSENATYLITGGLGGFGLAVARWMVEHGARTLVLMSRSEATGEAAERLQALRDAGARVEVMRGDVSQEDDVGCLLEHMRLTLPTLKGIVHAAMVLDDAPLNQLDGRRLEVAMKPKMAGAWHLHQQTLGEPLDFFVLFSSIASLLGNPLQANYAAANAFLDSFAHYRRAMGLHALTINWGVLSEVGYVSRHTDIAGYLERQGYLSFAPEQALDTLGQLLRQDFTQAMAARIDWQRWATSSPTAAASPRLLHFVPIAQGATESPEDARSVSTFITASEPGAQQTQIETYLCERVGRVLGISKTKIKTQLDQPLTELGFDSLIAVELMTMLKVELSVEVPVVKLLQGVSITGLTALIAEQLPSTGAIATAPHAMQPTQLDEPDALDSTALTQKESEQREMSLTESVTRQPINPEQAFEHSPTPTLTLDLTEMNSASSFTSTDVSTLRADEVEPTSTVAVTAPPSHSPNGNSSSTPTSSQLSHKQIDYRTLDYSCWSTRQKLMQKVVAASFRSLTNLHVEGLENIPPNGAFLLAVNHLSMADLPVMLTFLPRPTIVYVAEEFKKPWLNPFLSDLGNAIFVRRGAGDKEALELGLTVLRAGGILALGPEGRVSLTGGLEKGQAGAAYLATQAAVPVLPIVAWGQEKLISRFMRLRRPTINVKIGKPFRLHEDLATPPQAWQLREYTNQIMVRLAEMLPPEYRGVYADAVGEKAEKS